MRRCVYGVSFGSRDELGASDGPGGGIVAVALKVVMGPLVPKDAV